MSLVLAQENAVLGYLKKSVFLRPDNLAFNVYNTIPELLNQTILDGFAKTRWRR